MSEAGFCNSLGNNKSCFMILYVVCAKLPLHMWTHAARTTRLCCAFGT
uniref:Uncharacterized protein n=1 Tax=Anguilla anguilla TaxID=7936 RepID=A0A0E9U573_ANGAN